MKNRTLKTASLTAAFLLFSACGSAPEGGREPPPTPSAVKTEQTPPCCSSDFEVVAPSLAIAEVRPRAAPAVKYEITLTGGTKVSLTGLVDHNGAPVTETYLAEKLAGKPVAIYFGFPECTVFCPPSTQALAEVVGGLENAALVPLIISSKKDRTPEAMRGWVSHLGVGRNIDGAGIGAIGLTGSDDLLGRIYNQLRVNDANGNHVPYVALIDEQGRFLGGVNPIRKENGRWIPQPAALERGMREKLPQLFSAAGAITAPEIK